MAFEELRRKLQNSNVGRLYHHIRNGIRNYQNEQRMKKHFQERLAARRAQQERLDYFARKQREGYAFRTNLQKPKKPTRPLPNPPTNPNQPLVRK